MQFFVEMPSTSLSLTGLAAITGLTLFLASRAVDRREYVLEQ
jgi:hypothetical protein